MHLVRRSLTYLTILATLLLPLFAFLWARSYVRDESFYRVGRGRAAMVSCIRGEVALWTGPTRDPGPVRYLHETNDTGSSVTAFEFLSSDRGAEKHWVLGFGYGQTYAMSAPGYDPVRCVVVPLWFLTMLAAALPAYAWWQHMKRTQAYDAAELACCRRCGERLAEGETRCHACSFPAFIRQGVVA